MMVLSFFRAIFLHITGELLDGQTIAVLCIIRPVLSCIFAHDPECYNRLYDLVLDEIEILTRGLPVVAIDLFKLILKLLIPAIVVQLSLKLCQERDGAAVSQMLIEDLHEYILDGFFVHLRIRRALGIYIKQNHICIRRIGSCSSDFLLQLLVRHLCIIQEKA